jgi:hypothetical protein
MVGDKKLDTRLIGPIALFVIGIVVMFISGGDKDGF